MTYNELSQKQGLNLYESRHCVYITYSVKTWVLKNLSVVYARISKVIFFDLVIDLGS